jgi:thymidylate synthase
MSFTPVSIKAKNFKDAWQQASCVIMKSKWELRNLAVHIQQTDCSFSDKEIINSVSDLVNKCKILNPKQVAYTIFPHNLYKSCNACKKILYEKYNKKHGLFDILHAYNKNEWGTYFRRMTHYEIPYGKTINQLDNIINAINNRKTRSKACYCIIIQIPGFETIRPRGGPCLNYITFQIKQSQIGLLAVYRNHDFLERAYGNYWGLCNLLNFVAQQTKLQNGPITCISSHAYVDKKRSEFKSFLNQFNNLDSVRK